VSIRFKCEPWTKLRLPCPYPLIEAMKEKPDEPDDEEEGGEPEEKPPKTRLIPSRKKDHTPGDEASSSASPEKVSKPTVVYTNEKMLSDFEKLLEELARREAAERLGAGAGWQLPQAWTDKAKELGYAGASAALLVASAAAVIVLSRGKTANPHVIPAIIAGAIGLPEALAPGGAWFNAPQALETVYQTTNPGNAGWSSGVWTWTFDDILH
jgi:hypothetical protein